MEDSRMKTKLTKPILEALGKYPLFWARFESDSRTVASGFGLYAVTGYYENGRPLERRIYTTSSPEKATEINELIAKELPDPNLRRALSLNLERMLVQWKDFEANTRRKMR